ncbi:MAG: DNA (cytosine-5-)-methyltransferase [Dehalococcoidia bacterium]
MVGLTFIDLFAGIGGMRIGLEGANCTCVFSSEIDKFAKATYKKNFGDEPAGDIRRIAADAIPEHDIIAAGFPCQPFSIAGVSKKRAIGRPVGLKDLDQGQLFFEVERIAKAHQPRALLLENVKNLQTENHGVTLRWMLRRLRLAGYTSTCELWNARPWVPQNRRRLIIVALRGGRAFQFPEPPVVDRLPVLADILEPSPGPEFTITDRLWEYLPRYAEKHRLRGNGFGFGLADLRGATRTLSARYHKDGAEILIPQDGRNPRRLTPEECRRLMGFPDGFEIPVSNTQAYRQFGNAVVVPMIEHIAKALVSQLDADPACQPQSLVQEAVARVG